MMENGTVMGGNEKFFSFDNAHKSNQSDLLTYIGMTTKDVRYQKNKLKKSFLRLSFYDSDKTNKQHLLSYATIFFNSGELFAKYAKHVDDSGYCKLNYNSESGKYESTTQNLIGIGTDREYVVMDVDTEENRLSTRLTVTEKNISKNSSEGFYLYLFKETELGIVPQDIYMKVEFNHAGYGRTIPFMMPYKLNDDTTQPLTENDFKIKTFDEVAADWSQGKRGYGVYTYQKYSYIKLKARYDSVTQKHIYYLDEDVYGKIKDSSILDDDYTLNINLYEANLSLS
jgi:hypothetical protein